MSSDSSEEEEEETNYVGADDNVVANGGGIHGVLGIHPHQCHVCFKIFASTKGLVQHSIIHTDQKPFSCEICGKAFRFKSNLFEHRSIHSGEQPFVCPFCGKACRLKGNLKKHLKTHVKEPHEIDQAYEAVTAAHASSSTPVAAEYPEYEYEDEESVRGEYSGGARPKRKTVSPSRVRKNASAIFGKLLKDENNEALPEGARSFPQLVEMFDPTYSTEDFIRAARAVPFEKHNCRTCRLAFNCRYDMEAHCENTHGLSAANPRSAGKAFRWCEICLREFGDQKEYDQHFFFHRRVRALISKGELHVLEPKIQTYFVV